jgi:hypothetical protein
MFYRSGSPLLLFCILSCIAHAACAEALVRPVVHIARLEMPESVTGFASSDDEIAEYENVLFDMMKARFPGYDFRSVGKKRLLEDPGRFGAIAVFIINRFYREYCQCGTTRGHLVMTAYLYSDTNRTSPRVFRANAVSQPLYGENRSFKASLELALDALSSSIAANKAGTDSACGLSAVLTTGPCHRGAPTVALVKPDLGPTSMQYEMAESETYNLTWYIAEAVARLLSARVVVIDPGCRDSAAQECGAIADLGIDRASGTFSLMVSSPDTAIKAERFVAKISSAHDWDLDPAFTTAVNLAFVQFQRMYTASGQSSTVPSERTTSTPREEAR